MRCELALERAIDLTWRGQDPHQDLELDRHLAECAECTRAVREHRETARIFHQVGRDDVQFSPVPAPSTWQPKAPKRRLAILGSTPLGRGLAAATILLVVGAAAATGAAIKGASPKMINSDAMLLARAGDLERSAGLAYSSAGIAPEDRVVDWSQFAAGPRDVGRATVVDREPSDGLDIVAFRGNGTLLWSARKRWAAHQQFVLDIDWNRASALLSVASHRVGDRTAELLCLIACKGEQQSSVTLIDPASSAVLGQFVHPGLISTDVLPDEVVASAPVGDNGDRRFIVFGEDRQRGSKGPCVTVFDREGRITQHVILPTLGISGMYRPKSVRCQVDWSAGHETVEVRTSEFIWIAFPWRDGRLVLNEATVKISDGLENAYDRALGVGSYRAWIDGHGGEDEVAMMLVKDVQERRVAPSNGWRPR